MLEDALEQNVHINFIPNRTAFEETDYDTEEDQTDHDYEDYDRTEAMENIQLSEENINDLNYFMMMRMINDLGASDSDN